MQGRVAMRTPSPKETTRMTCLGQSLPSEH